MKPVIGSVPYLNARPLARWLESEEGRQHAEVRYALPSVLAQWLKASEVDAALVSSIEAFRQEGTQIVPGIGIASWGEVLSVRLFSKVPFDRIESIALDTSSLTSSALIQILMKGIYDLQPFYQPMPPDLPRMLAECDAGLLIGDKGMTADSRGLHVLDLGATWSEWTGLPFVWAVWLANKDRYSNQLVAALQNAKTNGLRELDSIIAEESLRLNIPPALCARYLKEVMVYDLSPDYEKGLAVFIEKCRELGIL